jgi:hypothetical protein
MRKMLLRFAFVAALIALPLSTDAYACRCSEPPLNTLFSQADAVFSGQVVALDTFKLRVQVDKVWKGETRTDITMLTGARDLGNGAYSSTSCDYGFSAGQKYLIFASGTSDALITRQCSGTAPATELVTRGPALDAIAAPRKVGVDVRACSLNLTAASGTGEIRVLTATPQGQALSSVTLTAESGSRKYGAITDRSGKSIFSGLQPGEYKITAGVDGYLARQFTIAVPASRCVDTSLYLLPVAAVP